MNVSKPGISRKSKAKAEKPAKASDTFDWSAFDAMDDADIAEAVRRDPDAAPIADEAFWSRAKVVMPTPKQAISIRLDTDVLDFFKDGGPGYQSRINAVLRSYVDTVMQTRRALIAGEESGISDMTPKEIRKAVRAELDRS